MPDKNQHGTYLVGDLVMGLRFQWLNCSRRHTCSERPALKDLRFDERRFRLSTD